MGERREQAAVYRERITAAVKKAAPEGTPETMIPTLAEFRVSQFMGKFGSLEKAADLIDVPPSWDVFFKNWQKHIGASEGAG